MMDEIICPACGRPNLAEAVRCWYCQEMLETQSQPDDDAESILAATDDFDTPAHEDEQRTEGAEAPQEEIPEWLKRIRALKEAEMKEEEERSRWQQQALFSGGAPEVRRPGARREPRKRSPQPTPHDTSEEPLTDQPAQPDRPIEIAPAIEGMDVKAAEIDTPEDLPDGYMPLDRE